MGYYPNVNPYLYYGLNSGYNPQVDIANASNLSFGDNPLFTADDFYSFFPQFKGNVEPAIITRFITMANASVKSARWHEDWFWGMCYFIAHFSTLILRTQSSVQDPTAAQVVEASGVKGLISSESAGDLSISYDYSNTIPDNIKSWGQFTSTEFGIEFAKRAWPKGRGGMLVH